jgi:hypothetical protein
MPPGFLGKHCPRKLTVTTSFILSFLHYAHLMHVYTPVPLFLERGKRKENFPHDTLHSTFDFEPMALQLARIRLYSLV